MDVDARSVKSMMVYTQKGQPIKVLLDPQTKANPAGLHLITLQTFDGYNQERFVFDQTGSVIEKRYDAKGYQTFEAHYANKLDLTKINPFYHPEDITAIL